MAAKHEWDASWSGCWPCLCAGTWTLTKDGVDVSDHIPEDLRDQDMGTEGDYDSWHFGGESGWDEEWETYHEGASRDAWVRDNMSWLKTLTTDPDDLTAIFEAFQADDFRWGSCGGCI